MKISENRQSPSEAREMAARCPDCKKLCVIVFPYKPTSIQRIEMIKSVLDEHRKVCTAAPPEVERKYELWYPRVGW